MSFSSGSKEHQGKHLRSVVCFMAHLRELAFGKGTPDEGFWVNASGVKKQLNWSEFPMSADCSVRAFLSGPAENLYQKPLGALYL